MLNVSRPVANSLRQLAHPSPDLSFRRHNCHILKVNYVSRRLKVSGHGYSGPKRVAVQQGIALGTADNPIVTTNNIAEIERQADGSWLCVAIRRKQLCASGTAPTIDVISDNEFDPFFSAQTDDFGSILTPDNLFLPPIESLGELSLPDARFPGETTFLCGIPPCDDCGDLLPGQTPVIQNDGCWKWDFRGASCGLYFRSQEAYFDYNPFNDTRTLDQVVAVRENYVYIATVRLAGILEYDEAHLMTFDISDPQFPVNIDDQVISAGLGNVLTDLGIVVKEDVLWVSGAIRVQDIGGGVSGPPTTNLMSRYDISTRTVPSFVSSWTTRLLNNFCVWLFFDGVTFTGNPYLVGFNWDWTDFSNCQNTFIVEDGLVGGEVQTLTGHSYGRNDPVSVFDLLSTFPPLVCDNVAIALYHDGSSDRHVVAIDLSGIPGAISPLWTDDNITLPRVYLGGNRAYIGGTDTGSANRLYTQTNIDATYTPIGSPFPADNDSVQNWGYWVKGNCLLRAGNFEFPNGWSVNISNPLVPVARSQQGEPVTVVGGEGSGRDSDADQGSQRVFLAHVGGGGQFAYLTIYTSP